MRKCAITLAALLAATLAGCTHTYRAEQHSVYDSTVGTDGSVSCTRQSEGAAREWVGPWPLPPAQLRP
jgi:hypothetical protein